MPQPGTIIGQITEELGELGKKVGGEASKVPTDIGAKALESLGSAKTQKSQAPPLTTATETQAPQPSPFEQLDKAKDEKTKQTIARAALEYLAGRKQKEPTVRERLEEEERQRHEVLKREQEEAEKMKLKEPTTAPKRGDFWGITKRKAGSETSRNVRQD